MGFDIFRVDWILVSSIIIILLIAFLVIVKIYKFLTRWRYTFANEDIILSSYNSIKSSDDSVIKFCRWNYVINDKLMEKNKLTVIILRRKRRISLLNVITEGLSSYGLRVVNVILSISKESSLESSKSDINDEMKNIFKSIMGKMPGAVKNDNYILISYSDKNLNNISISNEKNYHGHIIINSKINFEEEKENLIRILETSSLNNIYLIFSEYNILKLKNKNAKKCCKIKCLKNTILINNATRSFKYFETILFGTILNLINVNNIK